MSQPSPKLRQQIYERDGRICQYCGQTISDHPHVDHIIPDARGGITQAYNLVLSCHTCNQQKNARIWIPRNLDSITAEHGDWRARILAIATMPTVAFGERRSHGIGTTLSDTEHILFQQRLAASGLRQGEFIRRCVLDVPDKG